MKHVVENMYGRLRKGSEEIRCNTGLGEMAQTTALSNEIKIYGSTGLQVCLQQVEPYNPSFHFIFHLLFHWILHSCTPYSAANRCRPGPRTSTLQSISGGEPLRNCPTPSANLPHLQPFTQSTKCSSLSSSISSPPQTSLHCNARRYNAALARGLYLALPLRHHLSRRSNPPNPKPACESSFTVNVALCTFQRSCYSSK